MKYTISWYVQISLNQEIGSYQTDLKLELI